MEYFYALLSILISQDSMLLVDEEDIREDPVINQQGNTDVTKRNK